jgi:hypothetical protein
MRIIRLVMILSMLLIGTMAVAAAEPAMGPGGGPDWAVAGDAYFDGNKIVVTGDQAHKLGSAWCSERVDLSKNFDLTFKVYMGSNEDNGGGGIAFVLAPQEALSAAGTDLTYSALKPSLSVALDVAPFPGETEEINSPGPPMDDIALVGTYAGAAEYPGVPFSKVPDFEDGKEHVVRLNWNALSRTLRMFFDDQDHPVLTYTNDIVANYLEGRNRVKLGVVGSTGDTANEQYFIPVDIRALVEENTASPAVELVRDSWALGESAKWEGEKLVLTPDLIGQTGVAWSKNELDLTHDFDMQFRMFLGSKSENGPNGLVFVLTTQTGDNVAGKLRGYSGITPSVGVEISQTEDQGGKISGDLIIVDLDGTVLDTAANTPMGILPILQDGREHTLRVTWDSVALDLKVYIDDLYTPIIDYRSDLIKERFGGEKMVRFGFTATTGESTNKQYVVPVRM